MEARKCGGVTRQLFPRNIGKGVFYFDLPSSKATEELIKRIKDIGGKVENFFSKEVTCVITKRIENGAQPKRTSPRMQSQKQNTKLQHLTRAQSILANARQKTSTAAKPKKDVVTMAKELSITVMHLEELKELLKRNAGKENFESRKMQGNEAKQPEKVAVKRKLNTPFLKVEDRTRLYQPLIKEMNIWPKVYFDVEQQNCPFDPPVLRSRRTRRSKTRSSSSPQAKSKGARVKATVHLSSKDKIGYCELCNVNYRGLKQHLKGTKHRNNASCSEAYKQLDDMVRQGTSVDEYVRSVGLRRQTKQNNAKAESARTPPSPKTPTKSQQTPIVLCTPLKIHFSPRNGFSVVKTENQRKRKPEIIEIKDEEFVLNKSPKKRKIDDDYTVVQLSDLKLKIRRSTRILRGTSSDQHGSVFVDFPTYKDGSQKDEDTENSGSYEEQVIQPKYSTVQGKMRVSTRIMDAGNQNGLEEYKCPMYIESSEN